MSTMQNSDKKLKSEIAKLKAENKQLNKRLKTNDSSWKKKLAEAITAAESAIQAAYNQGHEDSAAMHEQKAKEKAKVLAEAEAIFNRKYKKLSAGSKQVSAKPQAVSAKKKTKGRRKLKMDGAAKVAKSAKMTPKKKKSRKARKSLVPMAVMERQPASPASPMQQPSISEAPAQPYKSEFDF
jgi:hypothetical protein